MKAKKFLCLLTGTALTALMAFSLTACSGNGKSLGKTKLNPDDYAVDYHADFPQELAVVKPAVTSLKKLVFSGKEARNNGNYFVVMDNADSVNPTYSIYNAETEKYIVTGLKSDPYNSLYADNNPHAVGGKYYYFEYIRFQEMYPDAQNNLITKYCYYTPEGVLLSASTMQYSMSMDFITAYISGSDEACIVIKVQVYEDGQFVTKYFKTEAEEGVLMNTLKNPTPIEESEFLPYAPEYSEGNKLDSFTSPLYEEDEDGNKVEGEMADYRYARLGNTFAFYKNGAKTGSVEIKNMGQYAFVDNYMYYTRFDPVDIMAQDGYNYVGYSNDKYSYSLHRYDILKNKEQTFDYNVVIDEFHPQFNLTLKKYDALIISGYERIDGVARYRSSPFSYAVDKELKIGYDLKEFYGEPFGGIAKLSADRYLVIMGGSSDLSMYLTDGNLDLITKITGLPVPGAESILFTAGNYAGFADYDGKIICAPKYTDIAGFYGGISYAEERLANGETREVLIDAKGAVVKDLSALKVDGEQKTVEVSVEQGFYRVDTTTYGQDSISVKVELYAHNGNLLKSFEYNDKWASASDVYLFTAGDSVYVKETVRTGSGIVNYSYNYYKVV